MKPPWLYLQLERGIVLTGDFQCALVSYSPPAVLF